MTTTSSGAFTGSSFSPRSFATSENGRARIMVDARARQYNWQRLSARTTRMSIGGKINADIILAMKAREEHRLTTLRMVKSALKSKEIDKRQPLTDAEETAILSTLLK